MRRAKPWLGAALVFVMIAAFAGAYAWDLHLRNEVERRFGPSPSLGVTFAEAGKSDCQQIDVVHPVAHYTWFGRMWQEPSLDWGDVQILHPPPREFPHNRSGPVRVGDVVCGFGDVSDIRYVHRPSGVMLTETCESYACPLE